MHFVNNAAWKVGNGRAEGPPISHAHYERARLAKLTGRSLTPREQGVLDTQIEPQKTVSQAKDRAQAARQKLIGDRAHEKRKQFNQITLVSRKEENMGKVRIEHDAG